MGIQHGIEAELKNDKISSSCEDSSQITNKGETKNEEGIKQETKMKRKDSQTETKEKVKANQEIPQNKAKDKEKANQGTMLESGDRKSESKGGVSTPLKKGEQYLSVKKRGGNMCEATNHHQKKGGETIKETLTDEKFIKGAGIGFVTGAVAGGFITH